MLQTPINFLSRSLAHWQRLDIRPLNQHIVRSWLLISALLMLGCSGCASLSGQLSQSLTPALEFRMNAVQPADRSGLYSVSGQTTLPDKTQITVSAIRYFKTAAASNKSPSYTLLDRQFAKVSQGTWQTKLNLWQTADGKLQEGKPQEAWQSSLQNSSVQPLPEVVFLATVDPTRQPDSLQKQLDHLDASQQISLVRFTPDGEQYVQVSQTLAIPAPVAKGVTAKTSDRTPQTVPIVRSSSSSASDWKQMPLPLSPDEFLR